MAMELQIIGMGGIFIPWNMSEMVQLKGRLLLVPISWHGVEYEEFHNELFKLIEKHIGRTKESIHVIAPFDTCGSITN